MIRNQQYQTPMVRTLDARQVLESLGPVSCGSNTYDVSGFGQGGANVAGGCGGNKIPF